MQVPYHASYSNKVNNDPRKSVSVGVERACAGLWATSSGAGRMEQEKDSSMDFIQKPSPASIPVLTELQVFPSHTPEHTALRKNLDALLSASFQTLEMNDSCNLPWCARLEQF